MALATQCPHCYTTFRVANDQLKLHAGLVRCGACQQTFNGVEHLLAPGAKPSVPAVAAEKPITAPAAFNPVQVPIPESSPAAKTSIVTPFGTIENDRFENRAETTHLDLSQFDSIKATGSNALDFDLGDDAPESPAKIDMAARPQAATDIKKSGQPDVLINTGINNASALEFDVELPELPEFPQEHITSDIADTEVITHEEVATEDDTPLAVQSLHDEAQDESSETDPDEEKPTFVIQAEKKQQRSRLVRVLMIISSTLLFFALLAQSTYGLRNYLAAWFPQTKPVLQEACKLLQCRIELLTQIDAITIESNELQALTTDKNIFFLTIQLQNRSNTLQAWPMLELILNNAKDKPILQRAFRPADYLTNKNDLVKGFAPNSEQSIKLYFELSGPKAAGYHVGVFYP
jgi:predicted Zn finger-like uncharacterized protein